MINCKTIIEDVKLFSDEFIRPYAQVFDINKSIPEHIINKLFSEGYLGATIPKQYGGLGVENIVYGFITREIGKACCSTRALLTVHTSLVAETLLACASKTQKSYWFPQLTSGKKIAAFALSENEHGSDVSQLSTSYVTTNQGFLISGSKQWVTFGARADFCLTFAQNNNKISAFMVDLAQPSIRRRITKTTMANKATQLAEIQFTETYVPTENLIGLEGNGFNYVANIALENGRYSIAWAGIAIAEEALDIMVNHSLIRKQFNQYLCQFQSIQTIIADIKTELEAGTALCIKAGQLRNEQAELASDYVNMAKLFSSRLAVKASNSALQILGAVGFQETSPAQRLYREAKLLEIIEGSTQIQQNLIAQHALTEHKKELHHE